MLQQDQAAGGSSRLLDVRPALRKHTIWARCRLQLGGVLLKVLFPRQAVVWCGGSPAPVEEDLGCTGLPSEGRRGQAERQEEGCPHRVNEVELTSVEL